MLGHPLGDILLKEILNTFTRFVIQNGVSAVRKSGINKERIASSTAVKSIIIVVKPSIEHVVTVATVEIVVARPAVQVVISSVSAEYVGPAAE